ncbi:SUMF1/EgtB/PvdO family nonheme iron enzyme [bacterium]|nr:SUMF1/EgtB/PvdO family nonheme iron enzyme [bacterium]
MTRRLLGFIVLFLIAFPLIFIGCGDDEESPTKPSSGPKTYEGSGDISGTGGRVEITDADSPIEGAYVEIPEGALDEVVTISLSPTPDNITIPGDTSAIGIEFEPSGTSFNVPVTIALPYSGSYQESYLRSNMKIFQFDPSTAVISQILLADVNTTDRIATSEVMHFSTYLGSFDPGVDLKPRMIRANGKPGLRLTAVRNQSTFRTLPALPQSGYETMEDVLVDSPDPIFSIFTVSLREEGPIWESPIATQSITVERIDAEEGGHAFNVYMNDEGNPYFTSLPAEDMNDEYDWLSGVPLAIVFDTEVGGGNYYMSFEWHMASARIPGIGEKYTSTYNLHNFQDAKTVNGMTSYRNDADNDMIDDGYQLTNDDLTPPVVNGVAPNAAVGPSEDVVAVTARALDEADPNDSGISHVVFEVEINSAWEALGEDDSPTANNQYSVDWDTRTVPNGMYQLRATGYDNAGNMDDAIWTAEVGNSYDPIITIETPSQVVSEMVTINFNVRDDDGDENDFGIFYRVGDGEPMEMTLAEVEHGTIDQSSIIDVPTGDNYIVWDSYTDFTEEDSDQIEILFVYSEDVLFTTDRFHVDNYDEPDDAVLLNYEMSPENASLFPGGGFIMRYYLENTNDFRIDVKLDAYWRASGGEEGELNPVDFEIELPPGRHWFERVASVSVDLTAGSYALSWVILRDDDTFISQSDFMNNAFEVRETQFDIQSFQLGNTNQQVSMVRIDASGNLFMMGADDSEQDAEDREYPQHPVLFDENFWIGQFEITQRQWFAVMREWPGHFEGDAKPVEHVSWNDIKEDFLFRINGGPNGAWRLPTEAEWEYAARAGVESRFPWGDDPDYSVLGDYAWFDDNSNGGTHIVGTRLANDWGLYDMYGNVNEWVEDYYHNSYEGAPDDGSPWLSPETAHHFARGGSWFSPADECRPAYRGLVSTPTSRSVIMGFRLVRRVD